MAEYGRSQPPDARIGEQVTIDESMVRRWVDEGNELELVKAISTARDRGILSLMLEVVPQTRKWERVFVGALKAPLFRNLSGGDVVFLSDIIEAIRAVGVLRSPQVLSDLKGILGPKGYAHYQIREIADGKKLMDIVPAEGWGIDANPNIPLKR